MNTSRKQASAQRRAANRARAEKRQHERVRARPVVPGARVKITRRCHARTLFITPAGDERKGYDAAAVTNFFAYTLGRALLKYKVEMHAECQMGDHHHGDVTDVLGNRPNFKNSVHGNIARGMNCRLGRFDSLWSGGGSCDTEAPSDEESLEDLAYTDTNPVTAGLVKWAHLWPGFTTYGWKFGETRKFRRPDWYYDPDNDDNPEFVEITRVRPKIFPELNDEELFEKLMRRCREIELEKQAQMRRDGRRFMGLKKLAKAKWWTRATSWEDRYKIKPKVASSDKWKRIAALQRNRHWEEQYAEARADHRAGKEPLYPYGTYLVRVRYNVPVAKPP